MQVARSHSSRSSMAATSTAASTSASASATSHHHHHQHTVTGTTDRHVMWALAALLIVYTTITLTAYSQVAQQSATATTANSDSNNNNNNINPQDPAQMHRAALAASSSITAGAATSPALVLSMSQAAISQAEQIKRQIDQIQRTFPIHVANDTVVIDHPGLAIRRIILQQQHQQQAAANKGNAIPTDLDLTMTVPKFFDESHGWVYGASIREYLGNGQQLMTPELAATIGSTIPNPRVMEHPDEPARLETIYCSIATYRDPECTGTVEDLYQRAKYPERIRVAILDQRLNNTDDPICGQPAVPCEQDPTQAMCRFKHLIDVFEMDARLAVGPVFARHLAHRHYRGEYFAMQLDSHVRFVEHWDDDIVGQWKSANNEMGVLTTYLSDIIGSIDPVTHKNTHYGRPIMCQSDYEGSGHLKHLRHGQQPEGLPGITGQPTLHPFWAAGFSFARGHFAIQVPYDQYLPMVFQGEEISLGLRGFTYGYDYYAPERSVCFHMYAIKENTERRKKIPLFWENAAVYTGVGVRAMRRLNSIIGMAHFADNEWQQDEIFKYGLGKVRQPSQFFKTFGIHIEQEKVEAHLCRFVGKRMMKVFMPALRANHMGLDYEKIDFQFVDPEPDPPAQAQPVPVVDLAAKPGAAAAAAVAAKPGLVAAAAAAAAAAAFAKPGAAAALGKPAVAGMQQMGFQQQVQQAAAAAAAAAA